VFVGDACGAGPDDCGELQPAVTTQSTDSTLAKYLFLPNFITGSYRPIHSHCSVFAKSRIRLE
jgi:hypothetical protein